MSSSERYSTKTLIIILISIILISSTVLIFPITYFFINNNSVDTFTREISILSENDFASYGFSGSGTPDNPYIVENLSIETTKHIAISIYDLSCVFIIRNCTLNASICSIYLRNIQSSFIIENDTVLTPTNRYGIILSNCGSGFIRNNSFSSFYQNNNYDFFHRLLVSYPYSESFIYLQNSYYIIIEDNFFLNSARGIFVMKSYHILIQSNNFLIDLDKNLSTTGIVIRESRFSEIFNNTFNFLESSIYFRASLFISLFWNNFSLCNNSMHAEESSYFQIARNYILNCTGGLNFYECNYIDIQYNEFKYNSLWAIQLVLTYNSTIHHNNFMNNNLEQREFSYYYNETLYVSYAQVFEDSFNLWYSLYPVEEGNYWSDLVWEEGVTYIIPETHNVDLYPLKEPAIIT